MFYRAQTARKAEIERYQTFVNIYTGIIQTSRLNSKIDRESKEKLPFQFVELLCLVSLVSLVKFLVFSRFAGVVLILFGSTLPFR